MTMYRRHTRKMTRRLFLEKGIRGAIGAGLLCSTTKAFENTGSTAAAYPDELNSIEEYTRGQLKAGDTIDAQNVALVKDLIDPVCYQQITELGRKLKLAPTTTDLARLMPVPYLEATLRNRGEATFDSDGNVVTRSGRPWIGGNPFPEPRTAIEVIAAHTLGWGRHDASVFPVREWDLDANGEVAYQYDACWAEMLTSGRLVLDPKPYWRDDGEMLRLQSIFYVAPADARGTGYLNEWPYDQRKFPTLSGYLPSFKRVRRFPTNQRFEPMVAGSQLYLSDAWAAGDPFLTWGEYRIVGRGPCLAAVSAGWNADNSNWEHTTHGGSAGNMFWDTTVELVPEAIVVEATPVSYPRAPISRKRVWFDARTLMPLAMVSYDRRGDLFRYFDGATSLYESGDRRLLAGKYPYWSWTTIHAFNVQTKRMTRIEQVREVSGGHSMRVDSPEIFEQYLTTDALQRLGS